MATHSSILAWRIPRTMEPGRLHSMGLQKSDTTQRLYHHHYPHKWGFSGGSSIKNPPEMQETWVQYLGWEDPLEKEMATHSSIVSWEIPWTEEPSRLQSMGWQRVRPGLAMKKQHLHKAYPNTISTCLEKEMATHSSVLTQRILGTEEPGRLLSIGLHRVRHY